jgi:hypothetical protein
MLHMRLPRADWLASGAGDQVTISGFEACRPLFGLFDSYGGSMGSGLFDDKDD